MATKSAELNANPNRLNFNANGNLSNPNAGFRIVHWASRSKNLRSYFFYQNKEMKNKNYFAASAILIGSCIGAGVLGIPYVASKAGFSVAAFYILFLGGIILLSNLYLGEVALRTKKVHQLAGYAKKYLGKKAGRWMEFALVFGIYASIIAYLIGVGESLSFLFFGNLKYELLFGILFGTFVGLLLWRGMTSLKKYEKVGVAIILCILVLIFVFFAGKVNLQNLNSFDSENIFLPFGVVLFALLSFAAVPEAVYVLRNERKILRKVLITSSIVSIVFYLLFAFIVTGYLGTKTPEVATLALGPIFIILGMFTMFTSHLPLGNALLENFEIDDRIKKKRAWLLASVVPVLIYVLISFSNFFSFTKVLAIGGVVSGGLMAILILFTIKKAKQKSERKPEYSVPLNRVVISVLILIFALGAGKEILSILLNL